MAGCDCEFLSTPSAIVSNLIRRRDVLLMAIAVVQLTGPSWAAYKPPQAPDATVLLCSHHQVQEKHSSCSHRLEVTKSLPPPTVHCCSRANPAMPADASWLNAIGLSGGEAGAAVARRHPRAGGHQQRH